MSTAKQLIPALVEAEPLTWDRAYSKNMRPIRGYPDYWRIIDNESYVDGPPALGEQYTKELFLWRAKILEDTDNNLTNQFEVANLGDYLTATSSESTYYYKYNSSVENYTYSHTDILDSISLEFDQLGRRLVAFESAGDINLIWYDPVAGQTVTTNFGAGYTPYIVTDTYRRTGGSAYSERLLFYVKASTKQIVYRRQNDRYQVEYTLPTAPNDVVEIIQVSKNLYGGLTVLYCYEDTVSGELATGSYTARHGIDQVAIGTDGYIIDSMYLSPSNGSVTDFVLKVGGVNTSVVNATSLVPTQGTITVFELRSSIINLNEQTDTAIPLTATAGSIIDFYLEETISPLIEIIADTESATLATTAGSVTDFVLKFTRVDHTAETESSTLTPTSGTILAFTLG